MLLEKMQQGAQAVKQALTRTEQAATVLAQKVSAFCQYLWSTLEEHIRFVIDYVSPPVKDADAAEQEWILVGVCAVLESIEGNDPVGAFCQMSDQERMEALGNICAAEAKRMGIRACGFRISELPDNVCGYYTHKTHSITINASLISAQPITRETAKLAILTVIHEMFHAYQYAAMYEPNKYGIPAEIAAFWRRSARDYCSFMHNPFYYFMQPLESYARYVEEGAVAWLNDPDALAQLRSRMA